MDVKEEALRLHEELKGKLDINSKIPLKERHDFSLAYTPGVAEPCRKIHENEEDVYKYTIKSHTIAVISNGSAVLGLGNIGAKAAIPVMEGKCAIFKELAGVDAFPICIDSENPEEIINIVKKISPIFGGVNLEDIKSPECFEIEDALQDIGIPVMHDDQHGTAIIILAGLINALKVTGKKIEDSRVIISGAGAASIATAKLLLTYGAKGENIILCDREGAIYEGRNNLNKPKEEIAKVTNTNSEKGTMKDVLKNSDVFLGLSGPNVLDSKDVKTMNEGIIFAMANPTPEIMPDLAKEGGARVIATGRSDFPNQVNNALVFPGIFKGALEARANKITDEMKISAAKAIASMVEPSEENILPEITNKEVATTVAEAVKKVANSN